MCLDLKSANQTIHQLGVVGLRLFRIALPESPPPEGYVITPSLYQQPLEADPPILQFYNEVYQPGYLKNPTLIDLLNQALENLRRNVR